MKPHSGTRVIQGFTLLELLIVMAILAILVAMLAPAFSTRCGPRHGAHCMNNQRQILIGEHLWSADNNGSWRWLRFAANPTNLVATADLAVNYFQSLHHDYVKNATAFVCSTDRDRKSSTDGVLQKTNLSYFASFTASATNPLLSVLTGDRNLAVGGRPLNAGLNFVSTNQAVGFTTGLHPNMSGMLGFVDGHVELRKSTNVAMVFQRQNVATNLLAIP